MRSQFVVATLAATALLTFCLVERVNSREVAPPATEDELALDFAAEIRPLIARYCDDCHGAGDVVEAEFNLAALANWDDASRQVETWQKVKEMVGGELMPPEGADQPSPDERARLERWVDDYLAIKSQARAGDPGAVVMRRLSNAEYTYTLRDLTGVEQLDPAREFPVDGAAGEGFTNTGNALVMSPALVTKYLDAAKEVASHAVLLPGDIRFSQYTTSRDWTNELLAEIRNFYAQFITAGGDHHVVQQGVQLDVGQGGRLPLEPYFAATLAERGALATGGKSIDDVARERGLNAKFLNTLWVSLNATEPSMLLDRLRARWRAAKPGDEAALADEVAAWQKGLFTFASVGLIGRAGGPKQWLEPISPVATSDEVRLKLPESTNDEPIVVSLVAGDAGDGNENDYVVWKQPRLVVSGRPDLPLHDVARVAGVLAARREQLLPRVADYLRAAAEISSSETSLDVAAVAARHRLDARQLQNWLDYLGVGQAASASIDGIFTAKLTGVGGHDFINGWGTEATPLVLANSSDSEVRVPGIMRPHGVCVHPSPTLRAAVGWRSPITATVRIEANVALAHPGCSNGVSWSIELRRGTMRQQLAAGVAMQTPSENPTRVEAVAVRKGDVVSLLVGPHEGNHTCDLTAIDLKLMTASGEVSGAPAEKTWELATDVSGDVLSANPRADHIGNADVWHFYGEPERAGAMESFIPPGSLLAKWQIAGTTAERDGLAAELQKLMTGPAPADAKAPDAVLYKQLTSFGGPLLREVRELQETDTAFPIVDVGVDASAFGKHPRDEGTIDSTDLCVQAPAKVTFRLPAAIAAGCELVTTAVLHEPTRTEGTAQVRAVLGETEVPIGLQLSEANVAQAAGTWTADNRAIANSSPLLVTAASKARARVESQFDEFRQLFPIALCYTKIVPVDEVVTLVLFHREDEHLQRLMLDDAQTAKLNRLWDELDYVSQAPLKQVDVLEQVLEYATQDANPKAFEPMRAPVAERAAAFRRRLVETEPAHVDAVVKFAERAYRRALRENESAGLRQLYQSLRKEEIPHEEAIRLTLARVLVSPAFLYRAERPVHGSEPAPVSDWELASRLSYFLWSSQPDDELRALAAAGRLHEPDVLTAQTRRMLRDEKIKRLATEFGCQWLHIHGFDELDEKSDRHFPTFVGLRGAMYNESILFFTHLFQKNTPVLDVLSADYTFLNEDLARHYGIPNVEGPEWRRVDGVRKYSRGGVLAQATTLAKQSGASRTSPILRGNWVSEVLLGERLPKPPKGVPPLPDDAAAAEELTVRQLVEKHVRDPKCAVCHVRIDPYGFALENFDAIGRYRENETGDRPIDARSKLSDGTALDGFAGLQNYLVNTRRDAFVGQFCRKLLGYALGRSVQLSDEPLLDEMQAALQAGDYRVAAAVETIVRSPQFRNIRGKDTTQDVSLNVE
jgi:hypothetical protein